MSLIGLGFWHRADTKDLTSLFDPRSPAQTPYRLTSPELGVPTGIELINMNDALNFNRGSRTEQKHITWRDEREYTTRIIRIYTHGERDQFVYDRLDWERKTPIGQFASADVPWPNPELKKLKELLRNQLRGRTVRAVIIKDLQKGVINKKIIDWLVSLKLGRPAWFVSSKSWRPNWLKELGKKVDLQLVMIPQVAAQSALRDKEHKLSRWITRSGRPSKEAVALIDSFATFARAKNIVVLPEGFSALACKCDDDDGVTDCAVQSRARPERVTVDMGFASVLFPALVACMSDHQTEPMKLTHLMNLALRAAYEWVESESRRVSDYVSWNSDPDSWKNTQALDQIKARLHEHADRDPEPFGDVQPSTWSVEREAWTQALRELGIVGRHKDDGGGRLELWRAMLEVDGYVCCEEWTREQLRHLLHGVQSFAKHPRYHTSCMLVASPGSGKTFLAKRLAESAGLRFIPFNITQMRSKGDILECLDTIVATQAENTGPLMVFIDEINAKLENAAVYGAFLTPLEDGTYVHSGRTFNIRPCVWVFAGTRDPKTEQASQDAKSSERETPEKGSDFASRLTLGLINLTNSGGGQGQRAENIQDQEMRATEKVYLGVCMLRYEFPDVRRVSELVLRAFWELPRSATVREIKHFVRRFSDIQYGEVTARSVPDHWPADSDEERDHKRWGALRDQEKYSDKADILIVTAAGPDRSRQFQ